MIEVEGPDGTVIEFPEGTAPETIKGVMAKQYPAPSEKRVAKLPDGSTLEIDVPDGADAATVERLGQEALNARKVRGRAVAGADQAPQPGFMDSVADLGANLAKGAAIIPDLVAGLGDKVSRGFGAGLNFLATGGGASPGNALALAQDRPVPSFRGLIDTLNPDAAQAPSAFGAELFGSMVLPVGPKAAPMPVRASVANALAPAKAASSKLVPGADEIVATGRREGVRVKTTDVVPPRTMMGKAARNIGERIPVIGTAGERVAQQSERTDAAQRLVDEFVGAGGDDAVNAVSADLVKTRGAELEKLTGMKTRIIDGTPGVVQAPLALRAIGQQITRLQGINAEAFKPVIDKLKGFEEVLESGKNLSQIEGNRKLLGDLFADPSLAAIKGDGQKALNAIYGPLREDMGAFIAAQAGKPQAARWKATNDRLAAMAGELKVAGFKKALNNAETTPEGAAKLIFSKTPSEVSRLFNSLSSAGKEKARAAVMFEAAAKSTDSGIISPQKFARALEAMQASTRGLFAPADAARIEGVTRLIKATQRASESAVLTNSGQQLVPAVMGAAAVSNPGLVISAGLVARAYESAPVRDLLLRLGRAKPGTPGYKVSLNRLNTTLAKMAPVAANDVDSALAVSPGTLAAAEQEQN